MAYDKDTMAAKLFLEGIFPLLKVVMEENSKVQKMFAGVRATVQFVARDSRGDLGAHLVFDDGNLEVVQGVCPDPDLAFQFASIKRMVTMLAGKPALFRLKGFYRVGLLVRFLLLLTNLTLLMPNARPKDPAKKRLKVKLTLSMMAAGLSRYNKLGDPEMNKWTASQPERIYQFSVSGEEDLAAYLRVKAGKTQAGPGIYTKRKPFVHMKFRSVDEAIPILNNEINMVKAVEQGSLLLEGSPEYSRDIGNFLMRIQDLVT
ncbi:MAG TPA: hypothetical protein ENN34_04980 [Deltaproteobacteria bacterium]|nr:hypothetical protein [Deltaproteobacteria bacterium]